MKKSYDYHVIVIGGGAAGLTAAKTSRGFGRKTLLVEQRKTGGECTWFGCIPSKTLIKSAHIIHDTKDYEHKGFYAADNVPSPTKPWENMQAVIQQVYGEEDPDTLQKAGIDVLIAQARIIDNHTIEAAGRTINAKRIILALGTSPLIPPISGLTEHNCLTNENVFSLKVTPASLLVLGGGPIGVELSQTFNRLGTKVTLIEKTNRILPREDPEMAEILEKILISEGIEIIHGQRATQYRTLADHIELDLEGPDGQIITRKAEKLLCSVGRVPNTNGFGLEQAGITYTNKGLDVDAYLRTALPGVYACGDIVGKYHFSHVAGRQGATAAMNAILPINKAMDYTTVLWTTYTDPEFARIGMTEAEAIHAYGENRLRIIKIPFAHVDRAITEQRTIGMAKFILTKRNRILGAHIIGPTAGELIHEVALLRKMKKPISFARTYMHAYPSYSDVIAKAAQKAYMERLVENPLIQIFRRNAT